VLHKSGKWMLVSNRDSESLNLFVVDKKTGMLSNSGKSLKTPNPVFAIFAGGRR
jgi:6-phosphogluconolactonase (cycloisomerase 2 family)